MRVLLGLVLCLPLLAWADFTGKVVSVKDGDTVEVMRNGKAVRVRLTGIDAPERKQAYGEAAKRRLSDRVFGKLVRVEERGEDRYQRVLGRILLGDEDINLEQISSGFAWHYSQYAKNQPVMEARMYQAAQEKAQKAKQGLWQEKDAIPPWEFRRKKTTK